MDTFCFWLRWLRCKSITISVAEYGGLVVVYINNIRLCRVTQPYMYIVKYPDYFFKVLP